MPHLFLMLASEQSPADAAPPEPPWVLQRLDDRATFELVGVRRPACGEAPGAARLLRSDAAGQPWFVLRLTLAGVAVNGVPLSTGIHMLTDRDEIRVADLGRVYFSLECPPAIAPFPFEDPNARCPRCQQTIGSQSPAVRCNCGTYYHQNDELPCFTYGDCVVCGGPGELNGALQWTPEAL